MSKANWNQSGEGDTMVNDGIMTFWTDDFDESATIEEIADDFVDGYDFNGWTCDAGETALTIVVTRNPETDQQESGTFEYLGSYFGMGAKKEK